MNRISSRAALAATAISMLLVSTGASAEGSNKAEPDQVEPVAAAKSESNANVGMRVYVDPDTGELVSQPVTSEQRAAAQATDALFVDNPNAIVESVAVDGSRMLILNGQHEMAMTATVDATGKRHVQCMDKTDGGSGPHRHEAHTQPTAPEAEVR